MTTIIDTTNRILQNEPRLAGGSWRIGMASCAG